MNRSNTYLYTGGRPHRGEKEGINHVIVEDGVEAIEDEAFFNWIKLESIHIPSSVKRIGVDAFYGCKSLTLINLPESLQRIGQGAFSGCKRLSSISLSDSLNEIGEYAFYKCKSLTKISIPTYITRIEQSTFHYCSSLSEVIIPPSVIKIDIKAFRDCRSLKSIKLPNGLQIIGETAFEFCESLESIQIPPSTILIDEGIFNGCSSLKVIYASSVVLVGLSSIHFDFIFRHCDPNLIILTDEDGLEFDGHSFITINNIHQCIQHLPYNPIPPNQQLQSLHQVLQRRFPSIAHQAQQSSLNLIHLIIYFPEDVYEPLSALLTRCPEAITAVDSNGKTPIHHVMTSTRHNMHPNCYDLLMRHCPDTVVHQAIRAGGLYGDDLQELLEAKSNALRLGDVESGLLPFMLATIHSSYTYTDDDVDLSVVYELLSMDPSVLKDYIL